MNTSITSKQKDRLRDVGASIGRSAAELILKNVEFSDMQSFLGRTNRLKRSMIAVALVEAKKISTAPGLLEPTPFIPAEFLGNGWKFDDSEPQDQQSLALKRLDPLDVAFQSFLTEGEDAITGEERLTRAKQQNRVRLDAKWFMALCKEEGHKTLEWFYTTQGVTWIEFLGSPLRDPRGNRYSLVLCRFDDGSWHWRCRWLGDGRDAGRHAALLES